LVKGFFKWLQRRTAVESPLPRIAGRFTTSPAPAADPESFIGAAGTLGTERAPIALPPALQPIRLPEPVSIAPATSEMRFMRLHAQSRFYEMWDMVAEDAQRAWGSRDHFMKEMPRFGEGTELLDMQVVSVAVLEGWTDHAHARTYGSVARIAMRYRIRERGRDSSFDRQVHLVPAAGGWRTLCYPVTIPTTPGTPAGR
jgi:hypothetical protein